MVASVEFAEEQEINGVDYEAARLSMELGPETAVSSVGPGSARCVAATWHPWSELF